MTCAHALTPKGPRTRRLVSSAFLCVSVYTSVYKASISYATTKQMGCQDETHAIINRRRRGLNSLVKLCSMQVEIGRPRLDDASLRSNILQWGLPGARNR